MGLFGTLFKGIKKIGKSALSVATHGASDKVLSGLKSIGQLHNARKSKRYLTNAMQAQVARSGPANVRITASRAGSVLEDVAEGGTYGSKARQKRRKPARRARAARPAPARKPARKSVARKTRRGAPRGGLDLAKMAKAWRAAGKPGTWRGWVSDPATQMRKA